MAWSKRKPYYHLKLSPTTFFSMAVRYLKDFFGKESAMEKPYREGRAEMHQDIPDYDWDIPHWTRPNLPEVPKFGDFPPLPDLPDYRSLRPQIGKDPEEPVPDGIKSPWKRPTINHLPPGVYPRPKITEPDQPPGLWVQPSCDIESMLPDCLDEGDCGIILAAANKKGSYIWGWEVSNPDLVSVSQIGVGEKGYTKGDMNRFKVCAIASPNPAETVEVCIYMSTTRTTTWGVWLPDSQRSEGIGLENKPDRFSKTRMYVSRCGCMRVTVPCDPCLSESYVAPNIAEDQGTISPGEDPCADSSSTKTITVSDGVGPYTWSVSGEGFCLDYVTTDGKSNVLRADSTACGTATITIIDYCNNEVTCYVRSTDGSDWVLQGQIDCPFVLPYEEEGPQVYPACADGRHFYTIQGAYKVEICIKKVTECESTCAAGCGGYSCQEHCEACAAKRHQCSDFCITTFNTGIDYDPTHTEVNVEDYVPCDIDREIYGFALCSCCLTDIYKWDCV